MSPPTRIELVLPYPPSLNRLYRTVRNRPILSAEGRAYKKLVATKMQISRIRPLAGPLCVEVFAYRPRAAGDIDNVLKALLDALNGHGAHGPWEDDSQIVELHAWRMDDRDSPRIELKAWTLAC